MDRLLGDQMFFNRPKCRPIHFREKIMHNLNREKNPKNMAYFCDFHKTAQS
jgi:hypothetical protein